MRTGIFCMRYRPRANDARSLRFRGTACRGVRLHGLLGDHGPNHGLLRSMRVSTSSSCDPRDELRHEMSFDSIWFEFWSSKIHILRGYGYASWNSHQATCSVPPLFKQHTGNLCTHGGRALSSRIKPAHNHKSAMKHSTVAVHFCQNKSLSGSREKKSQDISPCPHQNWFLLGQRH